jgi:hypothetical protein
LVDDVGEGVVEAVLVGVGGLGEGVGGVGEMGGEACGEGFGGDPIHGIEGPEGGIPIVRPNPDTTVSAHSSRGQCARNDQFIDLEPFNRRLASRQDINLY